VISARLDGSHLLQQVQRLTTLSRCTGGCVSGETSISGKEDGVGALDVIYPDELVSVAHGTRPTNLVQEFDC
jgi:hypothetical protein